MGHFNISYAYPTFDKFNSKNSLKVALPSLAWASISAWPAPSSAVSPDRVDQRAVRVEGPDEQRLRPPVALP